ncbi:hypothetical protein [Microvirga terrestris]|uniref:Uncharacterized protein n=1 Tax=Microvirga terrestris TaxID=2791024 RepID=A0ABS0HXI9_9HYPH|nr:hypothetical protein [Microvirga terrestris]MBF9198203.1 hypothetical protein [Microvirga terrestris]
MDAALLISMDYRFRATSCSTLHRWLRLEQMPALGMPDANGLWKRPCRIKNAVNPSREGHVMEYEIEAVARALYSAEDDAQVWDYEPEIIKDEFRKYAQTALALLAQRRRQERFDSQAVAFPYAA